jgi:uncharacterized protein
MRNFKNEIAMGRRLFFLILLSAVIGSCNEGDAVDDPKFDRALMLKNYAENLIVPAYRDVQASVDQLVSALDTFSGDITLQNLESAQSAWTHAYGEWMHANAFNVGPAAEEGLNKSLQEEISTFPASTDKINAAISSGQFNFNDFNRDARGFLALEYLLFAGQEVSNDDVLDLFQSQASRKAYLTQCALNIRSRINAVVSEWENGYQATFLSRAGTDVGSSASQLYNEFVKSFEATKNFKIGLPLGKRPGQTMAEPQLVEAYYSGQSLDFLKLHLTAIENIYFGKSKNGTSGPSFKDYLESVTGGPALVESTLSQWEAVLDAFDDVPTSSSLSELIENNAQPVEDLHLELQKHTRFFKSDMSSLLGIAITFSSGDGD